MNNRGSADPKSKLRSIGLEHIRNRNEARVLHLLPEILKEYPDFPIDILAIQDVYALALNTLPPRYTQQFSIVLREPVDDQQVRDALRGAIEKVRDNPTDRSAE
ncbi:MAG: late competence development ComFB family protein [Thermodesulfobacteriota bacterium]